MNLEIHESDFGIFEKRNSHAHEKKDLVFMGLQVQSRRLFMALEFFKEHQDRSLRARGTMFRR